MFNICSPFMGNTPEDIVSNYWYHRLWDYLLAMREFKGKEFDGIDATLDRDYLAYHINHDGYLVATKDHKKNLRILECTITGRDIYDKPTQYTVTNPVLAKSIHGIVNKDGVIIPNNKLWLPTHDVIKYFAQQLGLAQTTLNVDLRNQRQTQLVIAETDEQLQAYRKMVDDRDRGKPTVSMKKDVFEEMIDGMGGNTDPMYSMSADFRADKDLEVIREILKDFFFTFGIDCSGGTDAKSQYINNATVRQNNQQLLVNKAYWLEPMQNAFDKINDMFGTDLSVDYRKEVMFDEISKFSNGQSTDILTAEV